MKERSEAWVFGLTVASATTVLLSIRISQTLLALACLVWIVFRPKPVHLPRYCLPLIAFMAATLLSLIMSVDPGVGAPAIRKFVLFSMGILAANFVTTPQRAKISYGLLISVAALSAALAVVQFGLGYREFLLTGALRDDPTVLARATGFMGHWMTFSGEQLLVWCAAVPALALLGQRWILPLSIIGIGIVASFTRSAWIGAIAGLSTIALVIPRNTLMKLVIPVALAVLASSPLIYNRLSMSAEEGFGPDVGRLALIETGFQMVRDHPLFGVGPQRIETEFVGYYDEDNLDTFYYGHMHNNLLQIAAERGLICLIAFIWFFVELFMGLLRMKGARDPALRIAALSSLAALTGFLVAGLFEYNFGDSEVLMLFLFIVSIPFGLAAKQGAEDREGSAANSV
jgi:putative inorganic carbon (HCO3(-)) transporter